MLCVRLWEHQPNVKKKKNRHPGSPQQIRQPNREQSVMRPHAERGQQNADKRHKVKSGHQHVDATAESDPKTNCDRKPLPVTTRCTTSCHLRSTVSTCKAWTEPSSNKVSNSSRLCACGSVVSLLGTRRNCSLRWRGRFDLTSNRNETVSGCRKSFHASPHLLRRPSLSGRVYTGPKSRCPPQSARPSP